jgi:translation initiation factor IF-1
MYPYVIPFSGAALARDPSLKPHTIYSRRRVAGTGIEWDQPAKILPIDGQVREVILQMEEKFELMLEELQESVAHLPSRVRSLVWILSAVSVMRRHGIDIADEREVRAELESRLPQSRRVAVRPAAAIA